MFVPRSPKGIQKSLRHLTVSVCESLQLFHLKPLSLSDSSDDFCNQRIGTNLPPASTRGNLRWGLASLPLHLSLRFWESAMFLITRIEKVVEAYHFLGIQWHDSRVDSSHPRLVYGVRLHLCWWRATTSVTMLRMFSLRLRSKWYQHGRSNLWLSSVQARLSNPNLWWLPSGVLKHGWLGNPQKYGGFDQNIIYKYGIC